MSERLPTIGTSNVPERMSQRTALRAFGWLLLYIALVPPVAVLLWRVATMPWGS